MKNKTNKLAGFIVALFSMLLFTSAKAQCPQFSNALPGPPACTVKIQVTVYPGIFPSCSATSCYMNVFVVNPGTFISLNCTGCTSICNVQLTVLEIGGVPIPPVTVNSTTNPGPLTLPSICGATKVYYDNISNTFKVLP